MNKYLEKVGVPLPHPENKGKNVSESLIKHLKTIKNSEFVIKLVEKRVEYGLQKYGQPLMTDDKRDTILDALQEAGDLIQYIWKAKMKKEDLTEIINVVNILNSLLH
jgi:hypothetical protein